MPGEMNLARAKAIRMLEDCASRAESSEGLRQNYEDLGEWLSALAGASWVVLDSIVTINIRGGREIQRRVRVARGVDLGLDKHGRLLMLTVQPEEFRKGKKLMSFVGVGRDPARDVSAKHNEYFVETLMDDLA